MGQLERIGTDVAGPDTGLDLEGTDATERHLPSRDTAPSAPVAPAPRAEQGPQPASVLL